MFAKIENNKVVEYPIFNLRQRLPDVSLPEILNQDTVLPKGFVYVNASPIPEYDQSTQKITTVQPTFDGEKWNQTYKTVALTVEELQEFTSQADIRKDDQRRQAYQAEADPLFFKWQRGEATKEDWLNKISEITMRFP